MSQLPPIPLEEIARFPRPGYVAPDTFAFSPDDRLLTYLFSPTGELTRQLYALDIASGAKRLLLTPPGEGTQETNISIEEQLRRERQRMLTLGITNYAWADQGERLLTALPDGIYVQDGAEGALHKVVDTSSGKPALDPQFSPDGNWIAYVQEDEVYIAPASGGAARQLTSGARGTGRTHGLAEYVAQEEMDRSHGFWWSPGSDFIAFEEVDETHIPVYRILHQGKEFTGPQAQEDHRYPFAGKPNAFVRLGVIPVTGGQPVWMDLGEERDIYLARVGWLPDGRLWAQVMDRAQTRLDLLCFEPHSSQPVLLLSEVNETWINLHDMFQPLREPGSGKYTGSFIWGSERSGFCHLYLYSPAGMQPITQGDWQVDELCGVDEARGQVYFAATLDGPTERHLYAVPLTGGEPRRLTQEPGMHSVRLDHTRRRFVDTCDSRAHPPSVALRSLEDGSLVHAVYTPNPAEPRLASLQLQPPEIVTLSNRHGDTLYGSLYRPPASFGEGPFPLIIQVYGGPHAQMVSDAWRLTVNLTSQAYSRLGYLGFTLDNRGSARRGLAFEGTLKHDMGHYEVEDQVDGVRWLVKQGLADPQRVGIIGWSYGGYMAAMCLLRAPETFKVAVAGAPVSDWDGYDTCYTERYMGTPQSNPEGYRGSSVLSYVENLQGKLLLVHGLIDENVHFRHTARLVNALIRARKSYDLLLFPDERHVPRRLEDRVYMEQQIQAYFRNNL